MPEKNNPEAIKWWIQETRRQLNEEINYLVEFTFEGNQNGVENAITLITHKVDTLIWLESQLD